jgi:hypothetical protein
MHNADTVSLHVSRAQQNNGFAPRGYNAALNAN